MRIEKVNDNQIRCTLTKEDLADRQLKISELAYGTEKAKSLFRDMMQQASYEFGFEAEDIPLMIEAIPLSAESVILIITKVEYPEELDTRFSKFSDGDDSEDVSFSSESYDNTLPAEGADDILGLFKRIQDEKKKAISKNTQPANHLPDSETDEVQNAESEATDQSLPAENASANVFVNITKLFVFRQLEDVIRLSYVLKEFYEEYNVLYKNPTNNRYYLVITKGNHTPEDFNKVCNILTEYAVQYKYTQAEEAYFEEHYDIIVPAHAVQVLGTL